MKLNTKAWTALLLLGTIAPANATIARLKALGMDETDMEGSYYIEDNRNIFLNAGNIHKYADSLVIEWGDSGYSIPAGSAIQIDSDSNPKAKGGFLKSAGDWTYGLYLGNESNTSSLLRGLSTAPTAVTESDLLDASDNQLDVFFGRKAGFADWGVNLVYTKDKNDSISSKDDGYAVRFGMKAENWDGFINLSVGSKSEKTTQYDSATTGSTVTTLTGGETAVTHKFDGKLGLHVGGGYKFKNDFKVYAFAKKFDWEQSDSSPVVTTATSTSLDDYILNRGQQGTVEGGFLTYALGVGRVHEFGDSRFFVNAEYRHKSVELKFSNKVEAVNIYVPLTVGYEVKATEWLTLRGSVSQYLYGYRKNNNYSSLNYVSYNTASGSGSGLAVSEFGDDTGNKKVTFDNTTDVNAGMSLTFGRVVIDGLVGFSGTDGNVDGDEAGVFATDRLMSRLAMTYSF